MADEERPGARRAAYAARNKAVLIAVFGAVVVLGVWLGNWAAIAGGALGIGWVLQAARRAK